MRRSNRRSRTSKPAVGQRAHALAALLFLAQAAPALAQPVSPDSPPKWGAHIDLEGKLGNKRDLGEVDLFVPLLQDSTSLLFGNVRARLDDNASREGNFGLGVRHMLESGWNIGGYGYFDRRRSENHNYYNQVTLGAEALSFDWDLRVNAYIPEGRRTHSVDGLNTAEISGTSVVFRGGEERSLRGFDGEIGWRVPLFETDAAQQIRAYGGAYRFYADGVNPVQGPRGRLELTFDEIPGLWAGSRLTLGGEVQNDGPRGTQGFALARLRIPLQMFDTASPRLAPMERRMTDPVVRDVDIVSQAGAFGASETAYGVLNGQAITSTTTLSSASTSGAALPGAVAAAGANSLVILSGTFSTTAVTSLSSGQIVASGGGTLAVRNAGGRTATLTLPGSAGTVSGSVTAGNAATLEMANNSVLSGLTVSNSAAVSNIGVLVSGVSGATITNSVLSSNNTLNAGSASALRLDTAASNIVISSNQLTATHTGGAGTSANALIITGAGASNVTVSGNTFSATLAATNSSINTSNATFATAASTGNTASNGVCTNGGGNTGSVGFTGGTTCP